MAADTTTIERNGHGEMAELMTEVVTGPVVTESAHATPRPLTTIQRIALVGLIARDQQLQRDYVAPLQAEFAAAMRAIEEELALPDGAIGTTHTLDMQAMTVAAMPAEEPTAA